jgi:hypothetical protein
MNNMSTSDEQLNNPFYLFEEDTKANIQIDCMNSQQCDMQEKAEHSRQSRKGQRAPVYEQQCDSRVVNNDSSSNVQAPGEGKKQKVKAIKFKDEPLDLQCEWQDCDYRTCNYDEFVQHVSLHIQQLQIKINENYEGIGSIMFLASFLCQCCSVVCAVMYLPISLLTNSVELSTAREATTCAASR